MNTIRVWFTKTGEASYISHLDLQRVMGRAMRRAGLPVWYSLGFNPHIYMTFALPLSLGQESLVESVDFKTETPLDQLDFEGMAAALTEALPRGVDVKKIYPADTDPAAIASVKYQVRLPGDWMKAVEGYHALPEAIVEKKTKRGTKPLNLKEHIPAIEAWLRDGETCFTLTLPAGSAGLNLNPALLLQFMEGQWNLPASAAHLLRVGIFTQNGDKFLG